MAVAVRVIKTFGTKDNCFSTLGDVTKNEFFFILVTSFLLQNVHEYCCHKYGIKWRYKFNHSYSGIVTFGESKPQHFESMKNGVCLLRGYHSR